MTHNSFLHFPFDEIMIFPSGKKGPIVEINALGLAPEAIAFANAKTATRAITSVTFTEGDVGKTAY